MDIWRYFMNTKRLVTASIFALISTSVAQAADVMIPHQTAPVISSSVSKIPVDSSMWTGLYLGAQSGGFLGKTDVSLIHDGVHIPLAQDFSPKLSGFEGVGLYGGANIDLGEGFIFGVDTDFMWSGRKDTKTISLGISSIVPGGNLGTMSRRSEQSSSSSESSTAARPGAVSSAHAASGAGVGHGHHSGGSHGAAYSSHSSHSTERVVEHVVKVSGKNGTHVYDLEKVRQEISKLVLGEGGSIESFSHTLKQDWGGAARVRLGFSSGHIMPYIAGGLSYQKLRDIISGSFKKGEGKGLESQDLTDETKTMIGYTVGGGVDLTLAENVMLRAEYRYSDYGKKKFANEKLEIKYRTNDVRVGVAYKF